MKTFVAFCLLFAVANAAFEVNSSDTASQIANSVVGTQLVTVTTNLTDASAATYALTTQQTNFQFGTAAGKKNELQNKIALTEAKEYNVSITVTNGGETATQTIKVTIKPFAFENAAYKKEFTGDQTADTAVVTVMAMAGTGRTVTYSLVNGTDFSIDSANGKITVATGKTLSEDKEYKFKAKAMDGTGTGALTAMADVTVAVSGASAMVFSLVLMAVSVICSRLF